MIYISLLFIILAAICNAVMDTSVHHYSSSKLSKLNPLWWDGSISWRNKYINGDSKLGRVKWFFGLNKPVQITDAFHFFKTLMIIFICFSIVTFDNTFILIGDNINLINSLLLVLVYGTLWNVFFSLFYNKILR